MSPRKNSTSRRKSFGKVLRLDPANRDGNYNLGLVLMAKGSPAEAIPHFQRVRPADIADALQSDSRLPSGRPDRGRIEAGDGAFRPEAKTTFSCISRWACCWLPKSSTGRPNSNWKKPTRYSRKHSRFSTTSGQAYLRSGEYAKAELVLNRALKLKPDSPETLYLMAQVYSDQTEAVDALDLLVRAHKLAPQNTDIIFLLARVSMSQNYFEDAIPLLESGVKIAPQASRSARRPGRKLFHVGKGGKGD